MQKLQMTKEELLMIAKKNTENQKFICEEMTGLMRDSMLRSGIEKEVVDEVIPMAQTLSSECKISLEKYSAISGMVIPSLYCSYNFSG